MSVVFTYKVLPAIIFLLCSCSFVISFSEGDKCSLKDGTEGICRLIWNCPNATVLHKLGINPVMCGLKDFKPVVCCKDNRAPGDLANQKCKEYAEYAYDKIPSPTLLLKPRFKKRLMCDIQRNRLVVGRTFASRREFPHMALIGFQKGKEIDWACAGSLISENFVLTAAHCLQTSELGFAKLVRLGLTNKLNLTHMQERTVSEIIPHPKFNHTRYHDIGLVRLSSNVEFNSYVRPACLQTERVIPYDLAIATGWGITENREVNSDDLLGIVLNFFNVDKCNDTYKRDISPHGPLKDGIIGDLMICTGTFTDEGKICRGDTGGPLQVYHEDTDEIRCMYDIVGVTSFGKSCRLLDSPVVHTRVSEYIEWIEDIVWPK